MIRAVVPNQPIIEPPPEVVMMVQVMTDRMVMGLLTVLLAEAELRQLARVNTEPEN